MIVFLHQEDVGFLEMEFRIADGVLEVDGSAQPWLDDVLDRRKLEKQFLGLNEILEEVADVSGVQFSEREEVIDVVHFLE